LRALACVEGYTSTKQEATLNSCPLYCSYSLLQENGFNSKAPNSLLNTLSAIVVAALLQNIAWSQTVYKSRTIPLAVLPTIYSMQLFERLSFVL
jgi:hypothetical protein